MADHESCVKGIAFQTEEMRQTFSSYPELLLVDATYKLNDLRMPLYVLQNVDGNGQSEIVYFWFVASEDRETISFLMDKFVKNNSKWSEVKAVMTDKDYTKREVLTNKVPNASLLICLFHTLRSFQREISSGKMGISSGERTLSLEFLQKIAYSVCEDEDNERYVHFCSSVPKCVVEY